MLGPNGFHRHFIGQLVAAAQDVAEPALRIEYDRRRGRIHSANWYDFALRVLEGERLSRHIRFPAQT